MPLGRLRTDVTTRATTTALLQKSLLFSSLFAVFSAVNTITVKIYFKILNLFWVDFESLTTVTLEFVAELCCLLLLPLQCLAPPLDSLRPTDSSLWDDSQ